MTREPGAVRYPLAFAIGAGIGALGSLIGLGGAEFRLPLLIGLFGLVALEAVIVNKAISLVVVASALLFRSRTIPFDEIAANVSIIATLLAGSLLGAWVGADIATRLSNRTLYRVIAALLLCMAILLFAAHGPATSGGPMLHGLLQTVTGVISGFGIGVVAAFLGVAGGELLIPTLVLLFGVEIKLAGSLSLAVSLPTMIVGFARYSRDRSFAVLQHHPRFVLAMALGSILGTFLGGLLLGVVPAGIIVPLLAAILVLSAMKVWQHR